MSGNNSIQDGVREVDFDSVWIVNVRDITNEGDAVESMDRNYFRVSLC